MPFDPTSDIRRVALARFALLVSVAALLGGCASFSADGGVGTAQSIAYAELNKDVVKIGDDATAINAKARVDQLLKKPLSADSAVQIALNNRGLQAAFNELGIAEAQMVIASLPPNPALRSRRGQEHCRSRSSGRSSAAFSLWRPCRHEPTLRGIGSDPPNCGQPKLC